METTGTLLVGPDIAAAAAVVHALDVPLMGLNCATGPQEMAEHVRWLAGNWPGLLSVQPNAGLPELVDGADALSRSAPAELATWLERFVERGRRQPDRRLLRHQRASTSPRWMRCCARRGGFRPAPVARKPVWIPSVASLYQAVPLRQENASSPSASAATPTARRSGAKLQEKDDWDGCVAMGREQIGEGSNALDVCTAFVGRDETARDDRGDPPLHRRR